MASGKGVILDGLYLSTFAYTLLRGLREQALKGTELAKAQPQTLMLRLLKIAATVRVTARKIWVSLPRRYPFTRCKTSSGKPILPCVAD